LSAIRWPLNFTKTTNERASGLPKSQTTQSHSRSKVGKKFQSAYINNIKQKAKHNTRTQKSTKNFSTDSFMDTPMKAMK